MQQLVTQLKRWQSKERFNRFAWGFAKWASIVIGGVSLACFTDWLIDRYRDTPFGVRVAMTIGQIALYVATATALLFRLNVPKLDSLATKAEDAIPEFGHRLVTALQLNRPGAKTDGMSTQLIQVVTAEAETMAARHDLRKLADSSRLEWAAMLLIPVLIFAGAFVALRPTLSSILLRRQCLLDVDIPRSLSIENRTPKLWPSGDPVTLTFDISGRFKEESTGLVDVYPDGQPSESYTLKFAERTGEDTAKFIAELPPSSASFTFRARLDDGRTRKPGEVAFEPRPVVNEVLAWLRMPAYVDPEGKRRYERSQPQGEVTALPGCGLRVTSAFSKVVASAKIVFLKGGTGPEAGKPVGTSSNMTLDENRLGASIECEIPATASSYRIDVLDDNGFANLNPPRRGISFGADDPPRVNLLTEVMKDPRDPGPIDDYEITGMPLVLGSQVQIGYAARSPLGLSRAFVMYRVGGDDAPWSPLPLAPTKADAAKVGKFLPELGCFENSGPFGSVEFYQTPSNNIDEEAPGLDGGGRLNFQTGALKKLSKDGNETKLEVGDRVEFYVAVYDRNPVPNRLPGKSESRIKAVVTIGQLEDWNRQRDQSRERLKQLEEKQRGVFKPGTN